MSHVRRSRLAFPRRQLIESCPRHKGQFATQAIHRLSTDDWDESIETFQLFEPSDPHRCPVVRGFWEYFRSATMGRQEEQSYPISVVARVGIG
jgi:hypothetical protein